MRIDIICRTDGALVTPRTGTLLGPSIESMLTYQLTIYAVENCRL